MSAPSWVIDTKVLVSAALSAGGNCDAIVRAAVNGRIRLVWSAPILSEYRAVLLRPKFRFQPQQVASLLELFGPVDQVSPISVKVRMPDPDDLAFLEAANAKTYKILVTGNLAHFPDDLCRPVCVLSPAQAVERLAEM